MRNKKVLRICCLKAHLHEHPSYSDSNHERPSRSFERECRNVASQSQNWSDQQLCLNRFKLCVWFASRRIIQRASRSFEQYFSVFLEIRSLVEQDLFRFFFWRLMLSFEPVVVGCWSLMTTLWPICCDWDTRVNETRKNNFSSLFWKILFFFQKSC